MELLELTREFFEHAGRDAVVKTGSKMFAI